MNEHANFDEIYKRYLLGSIEAPERELLAEHLARSCPECLRGLQQSRSTLAALSSVTPPAEPSTHLLKQLPQVAAPSPRPRLQWLWAFSTAALLVVSVGLGLRLRQIEQERAKDAAQRNQLQEQLLQAQRHDRELDAAFALIDRPETTLVPVSGRPQAPAGEAFVNHHLGVVLIARDLPSITARQTFEMWLLPQNGKPIPAGIFEPDPQHDGLDLYRGPLAHIQAIAVSIEPSGGSPQPTTTPILVAKIPV